MPKNPAQKQSKNRSRHTLAERPAKRRRQTKRSNTKSANIDGRTGETLADCNRRHHKARQATMPAADQPASDCILACPGALKGTTCHLHLPGTCSHKLFQSTKNSRRNVSAFNYLSQPSMLGPSFPITDKLVMLIAPELEKDCLNGIQMTTGRCKQHSEKDRAKITTGLRSLAVSASSGALGSNPEPPEPKTACINGSHYKLKPEAKFFEILKEGLACLVGLEEGTQERIVCIMDDPNADDNEKLRQLKEELVIRPDTQAAPKMRNRHQAKLSPSHPLGNANDADGMRTSECAAVTAGPAPSNEEARSQSLIPHDFPPDRLLMEADAYPAAAPADLHSLEWALNPASPFGLAQLFDSGFIESIPHLP